ncbi:hypothetical protein ACX40Y_03835 [Sphingomonas sp. RS6]
MSDEPLAPEPVRDSSPLRSRKMASGIGFLAGVVLTAGAIELAGPHLRSAPDAAPAAVGSVAPAASPPDSAAPGQGSAPARPSLPPATDIATLDAREAALAARLDALELQLQAAGESARNASSYATQAERLLIAAAVRRAIERGQPLGGLERPLRARFGTRHPEAVAAIVAAAAEPVTLEDLRVALEGIAPKLSAAPDAGWWTQFRSYLGDLVVVRPADAPSPRAADRLRRARAALAKNNVEAAIAEIVHLPGASYAEGWTSAASRYVKARSALDEIERAAATAPPAPPPRAAPDSEAEAAN